MILFDQLIFCRAKYIFVVHTCCVQGYANLMSKKCRFMQYLSIVLETCVCEVTKYEADMVNY